jgi:hypothetical protein
LPAADGLGCAAEDGPCAVVEVDGDGVLGDAHGEGGVAMGVAHGQFLPGDQDKMSAFPGYPQYPCVAERWLTPGG